MSLATAESRRTTAGRWLLALAIPASALGLGSLPTEVLVVNGLIAAAACALLCWQQESRMSRATRWLLLALAVLLGMTVIQAVPLPAAAVRVLAPANAEIWERALSPLHEAGPSWHSISIAPTATRVEVLRGCFYGCLFLGALRVAALEHGEVFLLRVVVFSSVVMALVALAHMAVDAEKVFGWYRPLERHAYRPGRLAPLLNTNHLAAYLNVGACVALGACITGRVMPRALSASAVLVLAATSVWQGSRGATGALLLGLVLVIGLTLYTKRRFESARANAVVLAACASAAIFMVSVTMSDVAREHLFSSDLTKLEVAKSSLRLMGASPWFGVGRGGFEAVFSSVRDGASYVTFTHPEDGVVQWFVEWGLPASLAGAAMLGWGLRPHILLRQVRPAVGAWVAVLVTVLHDFVDYHLEVPGVVALVIACVAVVVSGRAGSRESSGRERPTSSGYVWVATVAGVVVACAAVWSDRDHTLAEDRRALSAMAVDRSVTAARFEQTVRAAMLRHPAEPFLPLMGAVRAQFFGQGSVVPWVGRALERSPRFGRAHFILARSLAGSHPAQARLEYRLAFEHDQHLRDQVAKEAVRLVEDADSALEIVPAGESGIEMLDALVATVGKRLPSTAVILDAEIARRAPTSSGPLRRRAEASEADAADNAVWCARKACVADGLIAAEMLVAREPASCEARVLVARLRAANGEAVRAVNELEQALDSVTKRADCHRELIMLALRTGQTQRGDLALDKVIRAGCGASAECTDLFMWAAGVEESRGHFPRAVRLYRRVLEITPDRDDVLERIGELGDNSGVVADALEAYGVLATRHPADPRWPARIAELRARAQAAAAAH